MIADYTVNDYFFDLDKAADEVELAFFDEMLNGMAGAPHLVDESPPTTFRNFLIGAGVYTPRYLGEGCTS